MAVDTLEGDYLSPLYSVLAALTALGMAGNLVSIIVKFVLKFAMPDSWKLSCLLLDVSHFSLGVGLSLLLCHIRFGFENLCKTSGFFLTIGVLDCLCIYLVSNVIMLFVQYPEKLSGYSRYPKWTLPAMLVPEKTITFFLSLLPILPIRYFSGNLLPPAITCFPIRETQAQGSGYGTAVIFVCWIVLVVAVIVCLVTTFRLWRSAGGRIHASSPDIWQTMMLSQGKTYQRFLLLEQLLWIVVLFITTVIIYTNSSRLLVPQWIAVLGLGVATVFHAVFSNMVTVLWSTLCCRTKQQAKEPFQKLKKLELIRIDSPGKIRMQAMWSVGRSVYRRGLLKVYGVNHLKAWAQEIVILGMMRKSQSASLLQCLWTNSGNPYFETMTLITGEIIPKESRLICFELTNSGTLEEFLQHLDTPLPEPCQRSIIHDMAEGLSCLHSHNILHYNLTSKCVYLKGSVHCMVLRAALGDFEATQIYGSLQGGSSSSSQVSRKQFFLPDIRAFALVALEIISYVCKKRQEEKQPFRKTRSEMAVDLHRTGKKHGGKSRDALKGTMHKSRSFDERALSPPGDDDVSDVPCMGSLINIKEFDPHPNVPADDIETGWDQPITSVNISNKSKPSDYSDVDSARTLVVEEWDRQGSNPRVLGDYARGKMVQSNQMGLFQARAYDNDYEELEEITEKIQQNQMAIRHIRNPQKSDLRSDESSWRKQTSARGHYSVPVGAEHPRFIDQTQRPALPKRNVPVPTVFHRSDPLRHSGSSVSTLEDIQEDAFPEMSGGSEQIADALRDLWLMQDEDKKEKLLRSYNARMRKELKDVFSLKKKINKKELSAEAIHELSRSMLPGDTYQSTPVVPFAESRPMDSNSVKQTRLQTAPGVARQRTESSDKPADKPVPRRRAPAPPRPATASDAPSQSRPQTAGSTVKKTQARAKLKRVIGQKQATALTSAKVIKKDNRGQGAAAVEMKYASVKKIPQIKETLPNQEPQSVHQESVPQQTVPRVALCQFSSFSSTDSLGSSFYKHTPRQADTSLTSGELTSLSSLAETAVPVRYQADIAEIPHKLNTTKEERVVNGKLIDSGFDSASIASDMSCSVSDVDDKTCSCPTGSYCSECCSCDTITPTSGMHTKPIYPRKSSWGNTDSFSSYDSTDLDQKLEQLRNGEPIHGAMHVLGPDEQYPVHQAKEVVRLTKHHGGSPSVKHHNKLVSRTPHLRKVEFGQATKRYRELRKKGVPMRVSVVSSGSSQVSEATDWDSYMESTAEVIEEEEEVVDDNDDTIFNKLDSEGIFNSVDSVSSGCVQLPLQGKPVPVVLGPSRDRHNETQTNAMLLDEIIRELPDEITGASSTEDETRSFLHYSQLHSKMTSEEETVDMIVEMPYETPSSVVDAELIIDRLFTKRNNLRHKGSLQDVMDPILGFDENLIRELACTSGVDSKANLSLQMLKGVTESHVKSCRELANKVPLVLFSELFPATSGQFRVLRSKLEKVGNFGSIGKQLLDTVQLCWVNDSPPSASDLVSRLLDTVTETEL